MAKDPSKTYDDADRELKVGDKANIHGTVTAVTPTSVTVDLTDKNGESQGQSVTCDPCCVHGG